MDPTEQESRVCELLDSFVPDLFTAKKYDGFLHSLFSSEKGVWLSVESLCEGLNGTAEVFQQLASLTESKLVVVWLDHPSGGGFSYVHFYLDDFFWTNSAIYNLKFVS